MNYLTTEEVAKKLGFKNAASINQMLYRGTIPRELTVKIGRNTRFIEEELDKWLLSNKGV